MIMDSEFGVIVTSGMNIMYYVIRDAGLGFDLESFTYKTLPCS
jgi:hypothetical protein